MIAQTPLTISWEKLPDDYVLPDDPVDNMNQPSIAAALTESLELAGKLPDTALATTNYGICARVNGKIVVKAPDWGYVQTIRVSRETVMRSYTPQLEGDNLSIVMEFLSETDGSEYSVKPTYPPGKWFFYEQVLCVPNYAIFDPASGVLEFYRLDESKRYRIQTPNDQQRYWVPEMGLFLGTWQAERQNRSGYWLRWWNESGELLLWGLESVEQERQRTEQEKQRAEQEKQRSDRLAARLRELGQDPDSV